MKPLSLKLIDGLEKICLAGAIFSVLAIMLSTNVDVVLRKTAGKSIYGLYGITEESLMVALVFLSIGYVYAKGGHVRVTLFEKYLPKRVKLLTGKCIQIAVLLYFLMITVANWQAAHDAFLYNELSSSGLGYPLAPAIFLVCLGCGVTALRILAGIVFPQADEATEAH